MFNNRNCLKCIKNVDLVFENGWLLVRAITMHLIVSDKIIGKCILLECQINVHYSINFFALHIENVQVKMEIMRKKTRYFVIICSFFIHLRHFSCPHLIFALLRLWLITLKQILKLFCSMARFPNRINGM